LAAGPGQPLGAEGQGRERRLHEEPYVLPLVHAVALHDALPAAHLLVEAGADPGGGVDPQVAPKLRVAQARAQEQLRRADRATGGDHGAARADLEGATADPACEAGGAPPLEADRARLDP